MPPRIDFKSQRLFVLHGLTAGVSAPLSEEHAHYLLTVLRMETGDKVLVFNGKDGEWRAEVTRATKRAGSLRVLDPVRPQTPLNTLTLCFAPLRKERMDWVVQKAVEMGVGALQPVLTDHTQNPKVRMDKLRANVIEAAEQCGVLAVPAVAEPAPLGAVLAEYDQTTAVLWCDEQAELADLGQTITPLRGSRLVVLVGPEGGFSAAERTHLSALPFAHPIALGPRILRADTAVVAALTAVQMLAGDWRG